MRTCSTQRINSAGEIIVKFRILMAILAITAASLFYFASRPVVKAEAMNKFISNVQSQTSNYKGKDKDGFPFTIKPKDRTSQEVYLEYPLPSDKARSAMVTIQYFTNTNYVTVDGVYWTTDYIRIEYRVYNFSPVITFIDHDGDGILDAYWSKDRRMQMKDASDEDKIELQKQYSEVVNQINSVFEQSKTIASL